MENIFKKWFFNDERWQEAIVLGLALDLDIKYRVIECKFIRYNKRLLKKLLILYLTWLVTVFPNFDKNQSITQSSSTSAVFSKRCVKVFRRNKYIFCFFFKKLYWKIVWTSRVLFSVPFQLFCNNGCSNLRHFQLAFFWCGKSCMGYFMTELRNKKWANKTVS